MAGQINPFLLKTSPGISDNINNITESGIYPIRSNSLQNTPINDIGILVVCATSETSLTQMLIGASNYRIYIRYMSGGLWYEWKHIKLTD